MFFRTEPRNAIRVHQESFVLFFDHRCSLDSFRCYSLDFIVQITLHWYAFSEIFTVQTINLTNFDRQHTRYSSLILHQKCHLAEVGAVVQMANLFQLFRNHFNESHENMLWTFFQFPNIQDFFIIFFVTNNSVKNTGCRSDFTFFDYFYFSLYPLFSIEKKCILLCL